MLAHPLTLRLLSAALVFGAWEYAGGCRSARRCADGSLPRAPLVTLERKVYYALTRA